jgi:hypothetical protein
LIYKHSELDLNVVINTFRLVSFFWNLRDALESIQGDLHPDPAFSPESFKDFLSKFYRLPLARTKGVDISDPRGRPKLSLKVKVLDEVLGHVDVEEIKEKTKTDEFLYEFPIVGPMSLTIRFHLLTLHRKKMWQPI